LHALVISNTFTTSSTCSQKNITRELLFDAAPTELPHTMASATSGQGAETGQRPGLTTRTDPVKAPPAIYMPATENVSEDELPSTPPQPIPVLETHFINYVNTTPPHQHNPSSPQPGPSRIIQPYTPSPPRRRFPSQMIGAARGRPRSRPPSFERNPAAKRVATPSPPRRVAERPELVPEEDEEEILILNVTPADTGFLGPILTKKPVRKRRR
jgi:FtsZ-interacting cell division protein ZipA